MLLFANIFLLMFLAILAAIARYICAIIKSMKLVEMKCKNCGAVLKVEAGSDDVRCEHCKAHYKLDDEAKRVKYVDMEAAGYEYEKGRLKARIEHEETLAAKRAQAAYDAETSPKSKQTALILCALAFVGLGGIHDFYLGRMGAGLVKLLTMNWFWIGEFVDLIRLGSGTYRDSNGLLVRK